MSQTTDKYFMKTMIIAMGSLFAFMIFINNAKADDVSVDPMVAAAIEKRIKPVGQVTVGAVAAAPAAGPADGKSIYDSTCAACHGTGAAGAPKIGDKGAWSKRIAQGMNTLFDHAINGFKGMPPRGGSSKDDDAIKAAVEHMVKNSK